jgi:hypothetical protein
MMTQTRASKTLIILGDQRFDHGYEDGRVWYFHGDNPDREVTWQDVLDEIKGNFLELAAEGFLDEERIRENAGFLVGWISGKYIPEEA